MSSIKLNKQLKRVEVKSFEIENEIVYNYFDNLPVNERNQKLYRAIYIGILALMEDRLSSFLSKTSNELGTELESLKMIFEMKQELFYKSAVKGILAEEEIAEFLVQFTIDRKLKDIISLTGNHSGKLPRNKTGDIICELNGDPLQKIVVECKFDKTVKLGDIKTKNIFTRKTDTAWSQLLESQVNREAKASIIVFDVSLVDNSILEAVENVGFIPSIGLIAVIDSQSGNYINLGIAYMLARDIAVNSKELDLDPKILSILLNRVLLNLREIQSIKKIVESNIQNNREILKRIEKSILLVQFDIEYLQKFFTDGILNKEDLLNYYMGEEVKRKYELISQEIDKI